MTRKKKPSRKYMPRDEFRYNMGTTAHGHLQFVFGETRGQKFKAFGITHDAEDDRPKIPLSQNPDPKDAQPAYIRKKATTSPKQWFTRPQQGFRLSPDDRAVVRHLRKQYNKSANRHPPGYYERKKQKKKKQTS